ncbi:MAG: sugar phosphate isomerase/epimerase [Candidatus Hydrogenedentes bacterium]|nr:sugar phosphate isomerase/epimerase [Candidatus Hydrogenedentota bacterium]
MISCLNPVTANLPEPEAYVDLAARNGFAAVDHGADFWANWVARTSLAHAKVYCEEKRCRIGHGGLPVNFRQDDAAFETDLRRLPDICSVNKALGIRGMATWIAPTCTGDVKAFRAMHVARLKKVAAVLRDHGLKLGLEFVGPATSRKQGNPFIFDMPGMLELCTEIDGANCGLLLDSYHWYTAHADVEDILRLKVEQVVHVHINDAYPGPIDEQLDMKRLLPGDGVIDLKGFLSALQSIGYDGPVAVETFSEELRQMGPEEAARRAGTAMGHMMKDFGR